MTKKEFYKVWKDSSREDILNQYYYDYDYMIELIDRKNRAIAYIEAGKTFPSDETRKAVEYMQNILLSILKGSDSND